MSVSTVNTTAGTTVAIGPQASTFDEPGYAAVAYDLIGQVTDAGEWSIVYNTASHTPLAERAVVNRKVSYTRPDTTIAFALVDDDPGQIASELALSSDLCFSVRLTRQTGAIIYTTAQISAFTRAFGTDAFELGSITLLHAQDPLPVPAP